MLGVEFELLNAFLMQPSKELYGREIERLAGTTHERTIVYLKRLVDKKILLRKTRGKQVFYRINKNNEMVLKTLSIAELKRRGKFIKDSKLGFVIQDLVSEIVKEQPTSVYFTLLFGSVARQEHKENNDIDLLFVLLRNGKTKKKIEKTIKTREIIIGKRISLHTVTIDEIEKRWLKESAYLNIWTDRIVFFGEENFWRFVLNKGEPQ